MKKFIILPILSIMFLLNYNNVSAQEEENLLPFDYMYVPWTDIEFDTSYEMNEDIMRLTTNDFVVLPFKLSYGIEDLFNYEIEIDIEMHPLGSVFNIYDLAPYIVDLGYRHYTELEGLTETIPTKDRIHYVYTMNSQTLEMTHFIYFPKNMMADAFTYMTGNTYEEFLDMANDDIIYDNYQRLLFQDYYDTSFISRFSFIMGVNHNRGNQLNEYETGYRVGYSDGESDGYDDGIDDAEEYWRPIIYDEGYQVGLEESNDIIYKEAYNKGAEESFLGNFDTWIVPAIIVVMFVGGFFAIARKKKDGDF